ncbi:MAG: hypothetical protein WC700_07715 [Gemmatimonadaceae bacterium]|jgi:hypothetical protein
MDQRQCNICLGAILVLVLVALVAWARLRPGRKAHFTYDTPSTPRLREAAGGLYEDLRLIVVSAEGLERVAAGLPDATRLAGVRLSAGQLARVLARTRATLAAAPPTYANYLAVYRGLVSTDGALLDAADAYVNAGHEVHQEIAAAQGDDMPEGDVAITDMGRAGNYLLWLGRDLRRAVASVHRLGAALDVE